MTETELREGIDSDDEEHLTAWEVRGLLRCASTQTHSLQIKTKRELRHTIGASKAQLDFMLAWDRFMHDHVWPCADSKVPIACALFAWKSHEALQETELQRHFLDHLHALFLFKLIQQEDIDTCMGLVRDENKRARLENKVSGMELKLGRPQILAKRSKTRNAVIKYRQP